MSKKTKYLRCGCCIDHTYEFSDNAKGGTYMFGDDDDVPYRKPGGRKKRRGRYYRPAAPSCTEAKNHLFVWVKIMRQNYREESTYMWGYSSFRRFAEPGEHVEKYDLKCVGCHYIKKTVYPNRRWGGPVPAEYEIYEVRHLDKYGRIL